MRHRSARWGILIALGLLALSVPAAASPSHSAPTARTKSLIAFDTRYSAAVSQIYTVHPDGSGRMQLTHANNGAWDPTFSPDGSEIAFVRDGRAGSSIAVMNADGGGRHRVGTDTGHDNYAPTWTPDGTISSSFAASRGPATRAGSRT